ncbi:ABC transporter ATP-binding protein [Paenibacillus septentrionalis]|uniref:ABC transporter ATP-binding protein n=1 Tax=Paenibacillus septentrionalis TaxID=429342 RepID=A0ABW1V668_9BACL
MAGKHIVIQDMEKVFKTRSGDIQALTKVNLDIEASSFVSIVGPSGCGKSTLMNLLAGLEAPTGGTILMDGEVVKGTETGNAVVFQKDVLLEWRTVIQNVILPLELKNITWFDRKDKKTNRDMAMELLQMVGLEGFENKYPFEMSGGMRQRVAICRGLIQSPTLLMMDEPFGALDALTREQMMYDLLKIYSTFKFTVVFITHSIEEAVFLSDRVIVMSPRPGSVLKDIKIDLDRPRGINSRKDQRFIQYVDEIRSVFQSQGVLSEV